MRAIVTRVTAASVTIDGVVRGSIETGFLVLLGVTSSDTEKSAAKLADKVCKLRVFNDENGKMNLDLNAVSGSLLVISQFTLYADCKSNRPGFSRAAKPDIAAKLYELFITQCRENGFHVECGVFAADMKVASINDGPVTLILDTDEI